jgi:predicted dehydrogenase
MSANRKIRMGMVGGGRGAFIGAVHRMAAAIDGQIELVCGAFSSNPEKSKASGQELYLPPDRCYGSFTEMFAAEAALPPEVRMDFVSIVTPNHMHYQPAVEALEHGFHVVCDKPLCFSMEEARDLVHRVEESGLLFALTHNYTGYPMVKEARAMIQAGKLGDIRRVVVEYPQGWLSTNLEASDQKQASWRTDPGKSGKAGAIGDIGTHAENLAEYITGLQIVQLCADLHTFIPGRRLDDDGSILLRLSNGARGVLTASQVAAGEENNLRIKVYGSLGGLEWSQQEPNSLIVRWLDQPMQVYRAGVGTLAPATQAAMRLPAGHPEGYLEAFANIYQNVAHCIRARLTDTDPDPLHLDFPTVRDGLRGMEFIEKVVVSSENGATWVNMPKDN